MSKYHLISIVDYILYTFRARKKLNNRYIVINKTSKFFMYSTYIKEL